MKIGMSESVPPSQVDLQAPPLGHVDALPVGTMLGEFELRGLLGVGGFGMVYQGYDHSLQRPVAIKEYMPSSLVGRVSGLQVSAKSTADAQPFQAGLSSFIEEARLLARFDHPSLVKVYRFWEANNTAYMAMPLYSGITLKQARKQMSGPPPEAWLRTVLWSVMEALKVLHGNNTLHRDVSPDNIFLQDVGPPVLLDLGAARHAVLDQGQKHTAVLKVNYAPIEQYADTKDFQEGPWTDLYAVGAVVHGCLCNEPPLPATLRVLRDRMPSFGRIARTAQAHFQVRYSTPFIDAIEHALIVEPSQRTQSVADFCEEMDLRAPDDLARFDWRYALGDVVTLDETVPLASGLGQQQTLLVAKTQPEVRAETAVSLKISRREEGSASDPVTSPRKRGRHSPTRQPMRLRWVRRGLWFGALALLVLGTAAVLRPSKGGGRVGSQSSDVVTSVPNVQVAPVVDTVPQDAPVAAIAASAPVMPVVAAPLPSVAVATVRKPDTSLARSPSVPRPATKSSSLPEKNDSTPPRSNQTEVAGTAVTEPKPAHPPQTICADSTFLTRTMCIYQECKKPEHTALPICIEDKKRWEKRDKTIDF